jgi:hypothetical protein
MLLLTAFRPFGLIRGRLQKKNASLEILEAIRKDYPSEFHFEVLDVDDGGIDALRRALATLKPSGLLAMGEYALLPGSKVVLEPFAVNCRPRIIESFPGLDTEERLSSDFALAQGADMGNSSISRGYCNAAYLAGLQWAAGSNGEPVAFVHVPVLGERADHVQQVRKLLWQIKMA